MNTSRRSFARMTASALASAAAPVSWATSRFQMPSLSAQCAERAASLGVKRLNLLLPEGSQSNLAPVIAAFEQATGVAIAKRVLSVRDMSTHMLLGARSKADSFDVALPATFELADLVSAQVIEPLDEFAARFEPLELRASQLYNHGSRHRGQFYGYQTDGDAYLLFLNRRFAREHGVLQAFEDHTGRAFAPPQSWSELDALMAMGHDPDSQRFGGSLFRTPGYLIWEFFLRLYETGLAPLASDLSPQIDSEQGVAVLTQLLAASDSLEPNANSNQLFANWSSFAEGNKLINVGWGGSQKAFRRSGEAFAQDVVAFHPPSRHADAKGLGYFNWGWNYVVGVSAQNKELAYLFTLFASAPDISTEAVRAPEGYFDPYLSIHYDDPGIAQTYTPEFLATHRDAMSRCIPDFYLLGQGEYFAVLSRMLRLAHSGELPVADALRFAANEWRNLHVRHDPASQLSVWTDLLAAHPQGVLI